MSYRIIHLATASLALTACTTGEADVDTNASGHAVYRDATADHQGQSVAAARPDPQDIMLTMEVSGTASLPELEPRCALDEVSGQVTALFAGEAVIDDEGVYTAALASGEATFVSAGGCTLPPLELTAMTEVVVRAELEATTASCETYCQAGARAEGEAVCGAEPAAAGCRGETEAEYAASCTTACESESTRVIVAETSLSATAIAELNARTATGSGLGELDVDLVFDHIE